MELKPGYNESELVVIPEAWDAPVLRDLFTFKNGLNKAKRFFGHGTPIVNYMDVYGSRGLRVGDLKGRVSLSSDELRAFDVRKGDVFFTRTSETAAEIGVSSVMLDEPQDTVFSGFVLRARPKDDSLDDQFKKYCFSTHLVRQQITSQTTETTRALTNGRYLGQVVILRPSLPEQSVIAAALSDVDALLGGLDRLIAKKRDLKQATMQQLLTGQTRLPGFHGQWEVRKISDFADCSAGGTPSTRIASYWGGSIRWMSSGELNLKRVDDVEGRITELGLANSNATVLPAKCVLIGLAGQGRTRGTAAMSLVELCTNQSIAAVLPNSFFVPEYLYYNLDARYEELREMSTGAGGRGGLNLAIIRAIDVPWPEFEEQAAIAAVLADMDAELATLEARRDKTRALKQGMTRELLTGRTRLMSPETSNA